jgi:hypothetical protein
MSENGPIPVEEAVEALDRSDMTVEPQSIPPQTWVVVETV